jgi:RHS repeat-associated protein
VLFAASSTGRTATWPWVWRGADPPGAAIDPNGNLLSKVDGADSWTYEWNGNKELTRVSKNGIEQARFSYDPLGRRVEKAAGGATTTYIYDGEDVMREVGAGGALKYIHGPVSDEPLAREDGSGSAVYYLADELGTVVKLTGSDGSVADEYRYDLWGEIGVGASTAHYAFTGREWDSETEFYYYRARHYDPESGRFIGEDPMGLEAGDTNLYAYVGNEPTRYRDPHGLFRSPIACLRATADMYSFAYLLFSGAFPNKEHGKNNDKRIHCLAFCRVSRACGSQPGRVYVIGYGKEAFDFACYHAFRDSALVNLGWSPCRSTWDPEDVKANWWGHCSPTDDCEARCSDAPQRFR